MEINAGKSGRGAAVEGLFSCPDLGSVSVYFRRPLVHLKYASIDRRLHLCSLDISGNESDVVRTKRGCGQRLLPEKHPLWLSATKNR